MNAQITHIKPTHGVWSLNPHAGGGSQQEIHFHAKSRPVAICMYVGVKSTAHA